MMSDSDESDYQPESEEPPPPGEAMDGSDRALGHPRRVNRARAMPPVVPRRRHRRHNDRAGIDRRANRRYYAIEPPAPFNEGFHFPELPEDDVLFEETEEPQPGPSRPYEPEPKAGPSHQLDYWRPPLVDGDLPNTSRVDNAMSDRLFDENIGRTGAVALQCLDCGALPQPPVTGQCGHTRCQVCLLMRRPCPCGVLGPVAPAAVDVVIQHILENLVQNEIDFGRSLSDIREEDELSNSSIGSYGSNGGYGSCSSIALSLMWSSDNGDSSDEQMVSPTYTPTNTPAIAPTTTATTAGLAQELTESLLREHQMKTFFIGWHFSRPGYFHALQRLARGWFEQGDLDCSICGEYFRLPVATPCGHTFCRACIERNLDYRLTCPLCAYSLIGFNLSETAETVFLMNAIELSGRSAEEIPDPEDQIPIFVCTVAFPTVPCPLYVFEPCYRLMIRRLRRSGRRHFGMVCANRVGFPAYGTMLEIRDSLMLPDGRSILSTVGMFRFRILEREMHNGYNIARVERLTDEPLVAEDVTAYFQLARQNQRVRRLAEQWLRRMSRRARGEIESSFGRMPEPKAQEFLTEDGPAWLWWVIAILPLSNDLRVMILSSTSIYKRMLAVERTLQSELLLASVTLGQRAVRPPRATAVAGHPADRLPARLA